MVNHRKHIILYAQFGMQFLGATSQTSKHIILLPVLRDPYKMDNTNSKHDKIV